VNNFVVLCDIAITQLQSKSLNTNKNKKLSEVKDTKKTQNTQNVK
jgi:hypothetical protein